MQDLREEWAKFGDITFDENDRTVQPFLHFPKGTERMTIWHWFDENDLNGIVNLLGIEKKGQTYA